MTWLFLISHFWISNLWHFGGIFHISLVGIACCSSSLFHFHFLHSDNHSTINIDHGFRCNCSQMTPFRYLSPSLVQVLIKSIVCHFSVMRNMKFQLHHQPWLPLKLAPSALIWNFLPTVHLITNPCRHIFFYLLFPLKHFLIGLLLFALLV